MGLFDKIRGKSDDIDKKTKTKTVEVQSTIAAPFTTFAGKNKDDLNKIKAYKNSGGEEGGNSLGTPSISEDAKKTLQEIHLKNKAPAKKSTISSESSIASIVSTTFCEGDYKNAIDKLKAYINSNNGQVEKVYWYMLMDMYQISNSREYFDKVALKFASTFNSSPPSWVSSGQNEAKTLVSGKNIIILDSSLKAEQTEKFKEFLKASKEEKFCRINISQCNFAQADFSALLQLHKLFVDLRKAKVSSVLMGENNLINFCKQYINLDNPTQNHRTEFVNNEGLFWLLFLEVLQWKGKMDEFEDKAFDYAVKFEISPPGWDAEGVMKFDQFTNNEVATESNEIDKIISYNNVQSIFNIIEKDFTSSNRSEIDLSNVERIDFSGGGEIAQFLHSILLKPENKTKQIVFKNPNEMILNILDLVGVTQFITVIQKTR